MTIYAHIGQTDLRPGCAATIGRFVSITIGSLALRWGAPGGGAGPLPRLIIDAADTATEDEGRRRRNRNVNDNCGVHVGDCPTLGP